MQPKGHAHFKAHQGAALTFPFTSLPQAAVATWHGGFGHYVLQKWHLSSKSICLQVQFCLLRSPGRLSVSFSRASASWALCSSGSCRVLFYHAFKVLKNPFMLLSHFSFWVVSIFSLICDLWVLEFVLFAPASTCRNKTLPVKHTYPSFCAWTTCLWASWPTYQAFKEVYTRYELIHSKSCRSGFKEMWTPAAVI